MVDMRDFGFKMLIINDLRNLLNILIIECTKGNLRCRTALIKQLSDILKRFVGL